MKLRKLRHIQAYRSRYRLRWYCIPANDGAAWLQALKGPAPTDSEEAPGVEKALFTGEIGAIYGFTMHTDTTRHRVNNSDTTSTGNTC